MFVCDAHLELTIFIPHIENRMKNQKITGEY